MVSVVDKNAAGLLATGAEATEQDPRYVLLQGAPAPIVYNAPPAGSALGVPPIRVANLKPPRTGGGRAMAPNLERTILGKTSEPTRQRLRDEGEAQRYFYERRPGYANEIKRYDADLDERQVFDFADEIVARNTARFHNLTPNGSGDGARELNVLGTLIAIAVKHKGETNSPDPLVRLALRAYSDYRDKLAALSGGGEAATRNADRYLSNFGERLNESTTGWEQRLADLRKQPYYVPYSETSTPGAPAAPKFASPSTDQSGLRKSLAAVPGNVHAQNMRQNQEDAVSDRYRRQQIALVTAVRLAARRAVNQASAGLPASRQI